MTHPYLTRRTQAIGFFAILLLLGAAGPLQFRFNLLAIAAALSGGLLLALAIYTQFRFGPRISEVPRRAPWPPKSFEEWPGVVMFVVAIVAMY